MSETKQQSRWSLSGIVSGLLLIFFGGVGGAMLGSLYVRLFVPRTGMGWDQLADALGGLMLGGLLGLVAGAALIGFLDVPKRLIAVAALVVISVGSVFTLRMLREPRPPSEPVVIEKDFAPWFRLGIRVGHTEEILRAVEPGAEPIPFTEVKIFTSIPQFEHTGWGPEFRYCRAEPSEEDMRALVPLVNALVAEGEAGSCLTPRTDDLGIPFTFSLDGQRGGGTVQADCLAERPALVSLAAAFEELAARICPTE